jgi:hypothetical protein
MELGINIDGFISTRLHRSQQETIYGPVARLFTRKIHVVVDTNGLPVWLGVPAIGQVERG